MKFCQEAALVLHLVSAHSGSYQYNNENYGAGVSCAVSQNSALTVGSYENSFRKRTFYLAQDFSLRVTQKLSADAFFGAASGYRDPWLAGGKISYSFTEKLAASVLLIPPTANSDSVAHLTLSFRFSPLSMEILE